MAEKFCTEYGCQYIFHPVRETVMVKIVDGFSCAGNEISVPLYGGPAMTPSDDIDVLGVYSGFTRETEFLVDEELAEQTLIGNVAIACKHLGKGAFYLFGPHFEHPHYAAANRIVFEALCSGKKLTRTGHESYAGPGCNKRQLQKLRSEISNARIVALALERMPCQWLIGKKVYDPEKIRVFIEAIWSRISREEDENLMTTVSYVEIDHLFDLAQVVTGKLKHLKNCSDHNGNTTSAAEDLFVYLKELTVKYLSLYFRVRAALSRVLTTQNSELKTP
jgi:hypothetical protein